MLELRQSFDAARPAARRPCPAGAARRGAERASRRRRPRREPPAARRSASSSADGDAIGRLHLRTGSYANWPSVASRGGRRPAARLPPRQQELRALLRLRRPLMLTLLRDLRRLRRSIALPRPERGGSLALRHVDAGSCNGCEHELTLHVEPVLRPAALRPRHRRLAAPRRRAARHRRGHDAHARTAARRLRGDARAAPRRRARRLRARLQPARPRRTRSSGRSRRCSPSTCASPAARRPQRRSPGRC